MGRFFFFLEKSQLRLLTLSLPVDSMAFSAAPTPSRGFSSQGPWEGVACWPQGSQGTGLTQTLAPNSSGVWCLVEREGVLGSSIP